ncbi:hypothetical protein SAMN05216215_104678 [Saccharopolyspora shandongensis]|uniref:Uncharacterized protein n=1 Tax=Saccharopolyspora shandongensis TaxID=418495 RepID=A0A1H3QAQ6_9PSEU|nr:hypothetical protein SAMN05216215_104678 [Saccharopolyspora shandongensis]
MHASRDRATVLHSSGVDIRLVKAPHSAGRRPSFVGDFDWDDTEARRAAANRNSAAYAPAPRQPGMDALFEVEYPGAEQAVLACRDVFIVWGAELDSGLTAGWLGLPAMNANHWLAVTQLWWDEPTPGQATIIGIEPRPNDDSTFGHRPVPAPSIKLKPRHAEGS